MTWTQAKICEQKLLGHSLVWAQMLPLSLLPETLPLGPLLTAPETFWRDALLPDHNYFKLETA